MASVKTQGTDMWAIDPEDGTLLKVACVTSIDGISSPKDQIETTCLESPSRTYVAGLETPGNATFGVNVDPQEHSHMRLHQLYKQGADLQFAIGWSDGTSAPTVSSEDFDLPEDRSWVTFGGYLSDYPFTFEQNAVVTSTIGVQISGEIMMIPKVASA